MVLRPGGRGRVGRCRTFTLLRATPNWGWPLTFPQAFLEVDDDLAVHVSAGLKLDRGADLPDRKGCGDRHPELTRGHQVGDLLEGTRSGVGAVRRRDPVDRGGKGGDAVG